MPNKTILVAIIARLFIPAAGYKKKLNLCVDISRQTLVTRDRTGLQCHILNTAWMNFINLCPVPPYWHWCAMHASNISYQDVLNDNFTLLNFFLLRALSKITLLSSSVPLIGTWKSNGNWLDTELYVVALAIDKWWPLQDGTTNIVIYFITPTVVTSISSC